MASDRSLWLGWLGFRPQFLQVLNGPRWFLFFICSYFFTQSIVVNGVYSVSITTIETRFGYTSLMTGVLTSSYDIAALLFTPFVSYLGATRKKPLICGTGMFIMGLGFFIFTLPHFFSGKYAFGELSMSYRSTTLLGMDFHEDIHCIDGSRSHPGYYALFITGMFTIGAGASPLWNLGTSYMDENVKAKAVSMYIGFYACAGVIGAGIGFVLGGVFLSMYVDLGTQTSLTPEDEGWVGAWWLGFVICTGFCCFWSLWLVAFPKEFPKTEELRSQEKKLKNVRNCKQLTADVGYAKLRDLPKATKVIVLRVPFTAITLGITIESFLVAAMTAFMPKVIQQQFRFSASFTSLLMGGVVIPAALGGTFIGSYVCKKLQLGLLGAAKMCYIVSTASLIMCCLMFLYCDSIPLAGVTAEYADTRYERGGVNILSLLCNAECDCSLVEYNPVCSAGVTYYSACHAGCSLANYTSKIFSNCSCVTDAASVTAGSCPSGCGYVKPLLFLFVYFLVIFSTFFSSTPGTVVTLRGVPDDQRAYALGLQACVVRLLGSIPGPVVLGSLLDATCSLWHHGCKGEGNCLEYNNKSLMLVILVMSVVCKLVTTLSYFTA
ncbi:predicted protein, partial [Nematostella vectensis]